MNQKCQFCGTPLAGYETFCPGCGRDLPTAEGAGFRPDTAEDTFEPIPAATPASAHSMSDDEWIAFARSCSRAIRSSMQPWATAMIR